MESDKIAYWMAIGIPAVLLLLGSFTQKLIEGKPFSRKHFYVGLDLTIYYLATCFVNVADLVRDHQKHRGDDAYLYTAALLVVGMLLLFFQTTLHQEWEKEENNGRRSQFAWLCIASNGIGLSLLFGFVLAKWKGFI